MEQIVKTVVMLSIKNTRDYGRSKQSILQDVTKLLTNCSISCYDCINHSEKGSQEYGM